MLTSTVSVTAPTAQRNRAVRRLADFNVDRRNLRNLEARLLDTQLIVGRRNVRNRPIARIVRRGE